MNDIEQLKAEIERRVISNQTRVLNKNAIDAALAAIGGMLSGNPMSPIEGLMKIFFGRTEALEGEKQRQTQQIILELVCKISAALEEAEKAAQQASGISLDGLIEVTARGGQTAKGAVITENSGPTSFNPGTRIIVNSENVQHTTGLQIGGRPKG